MEELIKEAMKNEFHPNTVDELRFLNHVMDEMITLEKQLNENKSLCK